MQAVRCQSWRFKRAWRWPIVRFAEVRPSPPDFLSPPSRFPLPSSPHGDVARTLLLFLPSVDVPYVPRRLVDLSWQPGSKTSRSPSRPTKESIRPLQTRRRHASPHPRSQLSVECPDVLRPCVTLRGSPPLTTKNQELKTLSFSRTLTPAPSITSKFASILS